MSQPQKPRSQFAATEIGLNPPVGNGGMIREQFKEESKVILQALQGIHHARKLDFMQVSYGDTVSKLSVMQGRKPVTLNPNASSYSMKDALSHSASSSSSATAVQGVPSNAHTHSFSNDQTNRIMKMKEFQQTINNTIESEHHLNMKKRLYNRDRSQGCRESNHGWNGAYAQARSLRTENEPQPDPGHDRHTGRSRSAHRAANGHAEEEV